MAKFVLTFDNLTKRKPDDRPTEQHEIIEALDKEEAKVKLVQIKNKEKIQIHIKNANIYRGTKPAINEGKR